MPGRTKSCAKKRQSYTKTRDKWMNHAVEMFTDQAEGSGKGKSLRSICSYMEEMCWKEDKVAIKLDKQTLSRRLQGIQSQADSNAHKSLLNTSEADALIEYAVQLGDQGWPFRPLKSTSATPLFKPYTISPFQARNSDLLQFEPMTEREQQLQRALAEAEDRDTKRKHGMIEMQSVTILQNAYVRKVNGQLHAQEEDAEQKKKRKKRFDGKAKLLTGDDFFMQVVEAEEKAEREEKEKEDKKTKREQHSQALAEWKTNEEQRKERNAAIRQAYHENIQAWEKERDRAKAERRRVPPKPKMGKLEKGFPRPKIQVAESEEDDEADDEADGDNDNDNDEAME